MDEIGCCGNDCASCPRYVATRSGDREQMENVARQWYRYGLRDSIVPPEKMVCSGCSSSASCNYGILRCAAEKNVPHCGKCAEYTCVRLEDAFGKSAVLADHCREVSSYEEFDQLHKAFFNKRSNLEKLQDK